MKDPDRRDPDYREAARKMMSDTAHSYDVSHVAHVHKLPDGAFVEVILWVPQDRLPPEVPHGD